MVQSIEQQTENVVKDTEGANVQLSKGIASARRARKLKWVCCILVTIIILALALGIGIYFGYILPKNKADAAARAQPAQPTPTA
jgi:syntaxin 1B/2/3